MQLDASHPASLPPDQLLTECDVRRARRSGPGGQHRNKVETAVILTHRPTGITAEANERRSQAENRRQAIFRLRLTLACRVRRQIVSGEKYVPSETWRARCGRRQIIVSETHDDFPAMLAEALDVLSGAQFDVKTASAALDCSPSQLIKLLKRHPPAITLANEQRAMRRLPQLK